MTDLFVWLRGLMKDKSDRQFEVLDGRLLDIQGKLRKRPTTEQVEAIVNAAKQEILEAVSKLQPPTPAKHLEVKFVFKVADDHQDEPFSISIGGVTDAEGQPIPDASGLTVAVVSSDDSVVGVSFDPSTNSGVASFGAPGVASVTASVTNAKGDILGSGAADFTVTTGDPAAVSDVKIAFGGLTEEP